MPPRFDPQLFQLAQERSRTSRTASTDEPDEGNQGASEDRTQRDGLGADHTWTCARASAQPDVQDSSFGAISSSSRTVPTSLPLDRIAQASIVEYPHSLKPLRALPSRSPIELPFAAPSDLVANAQGHVFPSTWNALTVNGKALPAKSRPFYRPPIAAPFAVSSWDRHKYSSAAIEMHKMVMYALPDRTAERWGYALKSYHEWCSMEGIADEDRFPITTLRLRMFISFFLAVYTVDTVKKKVAHLKQYSYFYAINWDVQEHELGVIYTCLAAVQPHPKLKRPPFLARDAKKLINLVKILSRDFEDAYHVCMLAATLVAFGALLRSGEFTLKNASPSIEMLERVVKAKDVRYNDELDTFLLHIPWDKTNRATGRDVSVRKFNLETNEIFRHHLAINNPSAHEPLFTYTAGQGRKIGQRVVLSKDSWRRWFNRMLATLALPPLQGHSIRIGGATQMLIDGVPPLLVMEIGGWKTETSFMRYWRHGAALIASNALGTAGAELPEFSELELREECIPSAAA